MNAHKVSVGFDICETLVESLHICSCGLLFKPCFATMQCVYDVCGVLHKALYMLCNVMSLGLDNNACTDLSHIYLCV